MAEKIIVFKYGATKWQFNLTQRQRLGLFMRNINRPVRAEYEEIQYHNLY